MQIKTSNFIFEGTYDELVSDMESDTFWIKFFIRPCCPKPDAKNADRHLNNLRKELDALSEIDSTQKSTLLSLVDKGGNWYKTKFCARI